MTPAEVAAVVGGALHTGGPGGPHALAGPGAATVSGPVVIDSREAEAGSLFVAFVGERADGHDFAAAAAGNGAVAVLGTRPVDLPGVPTVVVGDPQDALARLAAHVLGRLPDVRVIALTGSQGKTSTKDLLAAALADAAPDAATVATRGSFNNELGLPLTVLRATEQTRFLVLEMGARGIGHLRALCAVARPDVAVVLNVGKAHLGEFGTVEDIATAKGELVEALAAGGVAVLNADDPRVAAMATRTRGRVLTFGRGPADVRLEDLRLDASGRPLFTLSHAGERAEVALRLVGEHQALNAAAAAAAALAAGLTLAPVAAALGRVEVLSRWRMEVAERGDGVRVLNDSYNANPDSTAAALRALAAVAGTGRPGSRRTVAVLGEMRELGASAYAEHEAVGRLAVGLGVDLVLAVGEAARGVHEGARQALDEGGAAEGPDRRGGAVLVADNGEAVSWLRKQVRPGDVVLVKASRGARLDEVAAALLQTVTGGGGAR
jgi:UDP-N-acetylmuramoyl-tripeptide--D-alanyl-D-alanine ligase